MSLFGGGYIKGDRFFEKIKKIIGEPAIESLPISFTSVAVDLLNQKEFWFQRGDLIESMRASSAIPSIVAPVTLNGQTYVDGGVLNPLPIVPSISAGADYIVAVDLNGPMADLTQPKVDKSIEDENTKSAWWLSAKEFLGLDQSENNEAEVEKVKKNYSDNWGRLQTINMMFETMQESLAQYKLAGYPPDLLISIPKNISGFYEFWKAKELIEFGYEVGIKAIDDLESPMPRYHSFPKNS